MRPKRRQFSRHSAWIETSTTRAPYYRAWWRSTSDGEGVTVFQTDNNQWKWVHDNEFSDEFGTPESAMSAAEQMLGL